jgi:hypothetical protein
VLTKPPQGRKIKENSTRGRKKKKKKKKEKKIKKLKKF